MAALFDPTPEGTPPAAPDAPKSHRRWGFYLDALFVALGFASVFTNILAIGIKLHIAAAALLAIMAAVAIVGTAVSSGPPAVKKLREVFIFGVLVAWGMVLNHVSLSHCEVSTCDLTDHVVRPLAEPAAFGLLGLHVATVLAYAVSRARPEPLRPRTEALVHAGMLTGATLQLLVAVQFADMLDKAMLLPLTLPVLMPFLGLWLFVAELRTRLRQRASEHSTLIAVGDASAYREAQPIAVASAPSIHRPTLLAGLAHTPIWLGVYAVVMAAWRFRPGAAVEAFTASCGHLLSGVPLVVVTQDCHYLCTVAARGHTGLVKPERLGVRGGVTIVVNRQLAVANAFEDLLHERWPRFGRLARRTYDALGLPLSRLIQHPLAADAVYVAMKPAEWCFALALLLLDRTAPEARIARMYRAP